MTISLDLTIVICTYNRHEYLEDLLGDLLQSDDEINKIILVDNSTLSEETLTIKQIAEKFTHVNLLYSEPGKLSVARNLALNACDTPYIAYIDDDAKPCERWAQEIRQLFKRCDDSIVAIGGPIVPCFNNSRPDWLSDDLLGMLGALDLGDAERILFPGEYIYGGNMAFRVEALREAGAFDENLGRFGSQILLGNEDVEVQRRLRNHAKNVFYSPNVKISHIAHEDRLNQQWFFRRITWQAITETLDKNALSCDNLINNRKYLEQLSTELGVTGISNCFLSGGETGEVFEKRVWFIFGILREILNHGGYIPPPPPVSE